MPRPSHILSGLASWLFAPPSSCKAVPAVGGLMDPSVGAVNCGGLTSRICLSHSLAPWGSLFEGPEQVRHPVRIVRKAGFICINVAIFLSLRGLVHSFDRTCVPVDKDKTKTVHSHSTMNTLPNTSPRGSRSEKGLSHGLRGMVCSLRPCKKAARPCWSHGPPVFSMLSMKSLSQTSGQPLGSRQG